MSAKKVQTAPHKEDNHTLIIYGMYANFIQEIKHFDCMQTFFRLMASTLLLASFAAIGFAHNFIGLPYRGIILTCFIAFFGTATLTILCFMDLVAIEEKLMCNFAEAYKLEKKYSWLPNVHRKLLSHKSYKKKPLHFVFYYMGCGSSLILTMGISIVIRLIPYGWIAITACLGISIMIIFAYIFFLRKRVPKIDTWMQLMRV